MGQTPDNGVAIFCGVVDGETVKYVVDDPPNEIPENRYVCSNEFETDPLIAAIDTSDEYIVVVIERGKACIGKKKGNLITIIDNIDSHVMGKTKAGGQSADRFRRRREKQKSNFFRKVIKEIRTLALRSSVEGVIVAGTNITVDEFMKMDHDHRVEEKMLGPYNVSYASKSGVEQAVSKAQNDIQEEEVKEQREILDRFFNGLTENDVVYGIEETEQAIEWKAVDTLIVSEDVDTPDYYIRTAEEIGADVRMVSSGFEKAEIFRSEFEGVGAILHYPIN